MILYATPLTYERLHIKPSETLHYALEQLYPQYDYINSIKNLEKWSEIYEWYIDLFYFKGKKYLRAVHLSSSFTLFFANVDENFMHGLGYRIKKELLKYFIYDKEMQNCLKSLFSVSFLNFYSRITDKSRINVHNLNITSFNSKLPFFADFISDNCIDTVMLNKAINSIAFIGKTEICSEYRLRIQITEFNRNPQLPNTIINLNQKLELTVHEQKVYTES